MYIDLNKNLTDEQRALKEQAHEFAAQVMRPASIAMDKMTPEETIGETSPMWDVFRRAYEAGYHLRNFPERVGGAALGPLESHIVNEEMGWGSAGLAIALSVCSFPFAFAMRSQDPQIQEEVVQPFVNDRRGRYIGCWAITEPGHGSDTLMPGTKYFTNPEIQYGLHAEADGWRSWVSTAAAAWRAAAWRWCR
jgi:acyl-CoA dehydrogenase